MLMLSNGLSRSATPQIVINVQKFGRIIIYGQVPGGLDDFCAVLHRGAIMQAQLRWRKGHSVLTAQHTR